MENQVAQKMDNAMKLRLYSGIWGLGFEKIVGIFLWQVLISSRFRSLRALGLGLGFWGLGLGIWGLELRILGLVWVLGFSSVYEPQFQTLAPKAQTSPQKAPNNPRSHN